MFARISMLDSSRCDAVVADVLALREHWTSRSPSEFYTLGAASYLDEHDAYAERATALNPLLGHHFGWLYELLLSELARVLAAPTYFADGKAKPGFHVWGVPGIPTGPEDASLHFDMQYLRQSWPTGAVLDVEHSLSFTLPVRLPRLGGGLAVWNTTQERVDAFYRRTQFPGTLHEIATLLEERHEPYHCGELVLHSGHVLHRIAAIPAVEPDDLRITLQGHGLHYGGAWHLYW
jgi:hypothetical protein